MSLNLLTDIINTKGIFPFLFEQKRQQLRKNVFLKPVKFTIHPTLRENLFPLVHILISLSSKRERLRAVSEQRKGMRVKDRTKNGTSKNRKSKICVIISYSKIKEHHVTLM